VTGLQHEYVDPADMELRGMLAALGIVKGQPFEPDAHLRAPLDKGAKTAYRINHTIVPFAMTGSLFYSNRRWMNVFPGNASFTAPTFAYIDPRAGYFTVAYATSPGNGGHDGRRWREIPSDLCRQEWRLFGGRKQLQAELTKRYFS
jgi:hypothetical protein